MRVALVSTQVPFVRGGAELLAESLQRELVKHNHQCEIVSIPFNWHPAGKLLDSMLAASMIDLEKLGGNTIDLVIGLKFPAYLARHPNKRFWLVHQHRQAYDHWEQGHSDLLFQRAGRSTRAAIWDADRKAFADKPIFTISRNVSDRLGRFLDIPSKPLYHPPPIADYLAPGEADGYVLVPSRLSPPKRQDLVLRALARCRQDVRAIFVGAPDSEAYGNELRALAEECGVAHRVKWLSGLAPEHLAELYSRSLAVVFAPQDEDYGYVTLEGMLAAKPVITTTDSGGPLEFIEHELNGLVVDPTADAMAGALDRLFGEPLWSRELGQAGLKRYHDMKIGWETVIDHLVGQEATFRPVPKTDSGSAALAVAEPERPEPLAADVSVAQRAGVESIKQLLETFEFGKVGEEVADYLQSHWLRYLQTAALLPQNPHMRVLDLGAGKPHAFLALVKLLFPQATFEAVTEARHEALGLERFPSRTGGGDLEVATRAFNLETDPFPYASDSFDVVLAMEVVEHLALNPAHMFAESARVLRPGGSMIVTTPNIVSDAALQKMFHGDAPYSFGVFVPYHGVYGRHNREYTPHEVEALGRMSGLETAQLLTKDVYLSQVKDEHAFAARLGGLHNPRELRGQNVFYRGLKAPGAGAQDSASSLYLEDPGAYQGTMTVARSGGGDLELVLANTGSRSWDAAALNLVFTLAGEEGSFPEELETALPLTVPAGESRRLLLPIAPQTGHASCLLSIRLLRRGRGWMHGAGIRDIKIVARAGALEILRNSMAPVG